MKQLEHDKALLLNRIEAHRTIVGLEIQAVRATVSPVATVLNLLGVDPSTSRLIRATMSSVIALLTDRAAKTRPAGDHPDNTG